MKSIENGIKRVSRIKEDKLSETLLNKDENDNKIYNFKANIVDYKKSSMMSNSMVYDVKKQKFSTDICHFEQNSRVDEDSSKDCSKIRKITEFFPVKSISNNKNEFCDKEKNSKKGCNDMSGPSFKSMKLKKKLIDCSYSDNDESKQNIESINNHDTSRESDISSEDKQDNGCNDGVGNKNEKSDTEEMNSVGASVCDDGNNREDGINKSKSDEISDITSNDEEKLDKENKRSDNFKVESVNTSAMHDAESVNNDTTGYSVINESIAEDANLKQDKCINSLDEKLNVSNHSEEMKNSDIDKCSNTEHNDIAKNSDEALYFLDVSEPTGEFEIAFPLMPRSYERDRSDVVTNEAGNSSDSDVILVGNKKEEASFYSTDIEKYTGISYTIKKITNLFKNENKDYKFSARPPSNKTNNSVKTKIISVKPNNVRDFYLNGEVKCLSGMGIFQSGNKVQQIKQGFVFKATKKDVISIRNGGKESLIIEVTKIRG